MRLRRWPVIVGSALLFAAVGCDDASSTSDTTTVVTDVGTTPGPTDSGTPPNVDTGPTDDAGTDATQVDAGTDATQVDATPGDATQVDTTPNDAWTNDVTKPDAVLVDVPQPPLDGVVVVDATTSPKEGEPCEQVGDAVCNEDLSEVLLECSWSTSKWEDPSTHSNEGWCDCYPDENSTTGYSSFCATPGFVGIAKASKTRTVTRSLRRV